MQEDTRIIDSNALMAQKLSTPAPKKLVPKPEDKDGFSAGLSADVLEVLMDDPDAMESAMPAEETAEVQQEIYTGPTADELREEAIAEIEAMKKKRKPSCILKESRCLVRQGRKVIRKAIKRV